VTQAEASLGELARRIFSRPVPHIEELGIVLVERLPRGAIMRLPYDARLVGNPDSGGLFGGGVTTLIDSACGFAAMSSLPVVGPVATLDLRVDYLRHTQPDKDVTVRAECYRLTRRVAFCRAEAYYDDPAEPLAAALGSFMIADPDADKAAAGGR
jgi:uncharacterized protein (TIGR00369 family)